LAGAIYLTPCPPWDSLRWTPTTIDLTLDAEIRAWVPPGSGGEDLVLDPLAAGFNANEVVRRHTQRFDCTGGYVLDLGHLVLGWTVDCCWGRSEQ
jgi:hypothetical protein